MSHADSRLDLHDSLDPGLVVAAVPGVRFLTAGEVLDAGHQLEAPSTLFVAVMGADGDFVVYRTDDRSRVWSSGTAGHPDAQLAMQDDGDVVIRAASGARLWRSATDAHPGAFMEVRDDGQLVIRDFYRTPVWTSTTSAPQARSVGAGT
jgi:hypothetical protein